MPVEEQAPVIREYIKKQFELCDIHDYPFCHTFFDDFFPINFYRQLNRHFPGYNDDGFKEELPHYPNRFVKSVFNYTQDDVSRSNIFATISDIFDRSLAETILNKFNISSYDKLGWHCDYCWDLPKGNKQAIQPHLDHKAKIISMIVYLPLVETPLRIINKQIQYFKIPGTDLLIQNDNKTFTKVREIQAWCNRVTAFHKSETSWHSVEETQHPRRTITMFIVNPELCDKESFGFKAV